MPYLEELAGLEALHQSGAMNDQEFTQAKNQLLELPSEFIPPQQSSDDEMEGVDEDAAARNDGPPCFDGKQEIVVALDGSGDCLLLTQAVEGASPGTTIKVKGGVHSARMRITKNLTIVGVDGARLRPELPAEMAKRLSQEIREAGELVDWYKRWALPAVVLPQLRANVTINPIKRLKIRKLSKALASTARESERSQKIQPLKELSDKLFDGFVEIDNARVVFRDLHLGFSASEKKAYANDERLNLLPAEFREHFNRKPLKSGKSRVRKYWVSLQDAEEWAVTQGFDPEDVRATRSQIEERDRKRGFKTRNDPDVRSVQEAWWADTGGRPPDPFSINSGGWSPNPLLVLYQVASNFEVDWKSPLITFSADTSQHGLTLENCTIDGQEVFPYGLHASSSHPEARCVLTGTSIEGTLKGREFQAARNVWETENAAIRIEWPKSSATPAIQLAGCTIASGYCGIDLYGGAALIEDCTVQDNELCGIRVHGAPSQPKRAEALIENCVLKNMKHTGILGFRMDERTININHRNTTFKNTGKFEDAVSQSAEFRQKLKDDAKKAARARALETARRREERAKRAAEQAAIRKKAQERAEAIAVAKSRAMAVRTAKALARKRNSHLSHPHHPNVLITPSGKLLPAKGYVWASSKDGDLRVKRKQAPKPTGPKLSRPIGRCSVPCEIPSCGARISGRLFFFNGRNFPDGMARGWFCSATCINKAEKYCHFGMPHKDFAKGQLVSVLDDGSGAGLYLLDDYDNEILAPVGTRMTVASNQYWMRGTSYASGANGEIELEDYMAVTVKYQGRLYPGTYVGALQRV